MIASLPLFHRIAGQPIIVLGGGEAAEAKRRLVERAGGIVDGEDSAAKLAFIAIEDEAEAEAAAERLRARGVLVNVVDRPALCDFTVPSLLDRSPVLIAIGTGGASAGLAKALRLRLERLLPVSIGKLASALGASRQLLRAQWPDAGERRRALDAALDDGGALDPLVPASSDRVAGWLSGGGRSSPGGVVEFTLRSDDPEDLSLRELRWLGSADLIAYDPGVPAAILDRARADAARQELAAAALPVSRSGLTVIIRQG